MKNQKNSDKYLQRRKRLLESPPDKCPVCGSGFSGQLLDWFKEIPQWRCNRCRKFFDFTPQN